MVRHFQLVEPESGHLVQNGALAGNPAGQHPVKGTDPVRADEQERIAEIINVPYFARLGRHAGDRSLHYYWHCVSSWVRV